MNEFLKKNMQFIYIQTKQMLQNVIKCCKMISPHNNVCCVYELACGLRSRRHICIIGYQSYSSSYDRNAKFAKFIDFQPGSLKNKTKILKK